MRRLFHLPILGFAIFRRPWAIVAIDVRWWCQCLGIPYRGTASLFDQFRKPEFRNLFYHRFSHAGRIPRICARVASIFLRPEPTCHLDTPDIGEGLYVAHGICTLVAAARIGKYCWLNQQISIGYADTAGTPVLEDGVRVYCGAKVLGAITIGRNTRIGANAVVLKDAPPDCTLVGVPARIVRRNGERVDEPL